MLTGIGITAGSTETVAVGLLELNHIAESWASKVISANSLSIKKLFDKLLLLDIEINNENATYINQSPIKINTLFKSIKEYLKNKLTT